MKDPHEIFDEEDKMILEVFPYPNWIKLFNYFFPKTEKHKPIDWRKRIKTWASWAPWLTIALFIVILFIAYGRGEFDGISIFAGVLLIPCSIRFVYLLCLAVFAKCLKRSPTSALCLMPVPPLFSVGLLCVVLFFDWISSDGSEGKSSDRSKYQKEKVAETQVESKGSRLSLIHI